MNWETAGLTPGITGAVLGLAGGLIGSYFSIKNTESPRERGFMIRAVAGFWLLLLAGLALAYCFPPARPWIWVPITFAVLVGVPRLNRRQHQIRVKESARGRETN